MKQPVDVINIWYSPVINKWTPCALVVKGDLLKRDKKVHKNFKECMKFVNSNYKDLRKV